MTIDDGADWVRLGNWNLGLRVYNFSLAVTMEEKKAEHIYLRFKLLTELRWELAQYKADKVKVQSRIDECEKRIAGLEKEIKEIE